MYSTMRATKVKYSDKRQCWQIAVDVKKCNLKQLFGQQFCNI
jgi:hypothetical protein